MIKIFFLGATGYIGGSVLSELLKQQDKYAITALVRSQDKIDKLKTLGVSSVFGTLDDKDLIRQQAYEADVVINTASADKPISSQAIVEGLEKKFKDTGKKSSFIHTSGTAIIMEHTNGEAASGRVWCDTENDALNAIPESVIHRGVDSLLINHSENFNLVIIAPPTVFGLGTGPEGVANRVSVQLPVLIRAALKYHKSFQIGAGKNEWSAVHVADLAELYGIILDKLLKGELKDTGRNGYYIPEQGKWVQEQVSQALAKYIVNKGLTQDESVTPINAPMEAIQWLGLPGFLISSSTKAKGEKARATGWVPKHGENAVMEGLEEEIEYISKQPYKRYIPEPQPPENKQN